MPDQPPKNAAMSHVVGPALTMDSRSRGRVLRQRCLWCGVLILEVELDRVAVQLPADGSEPRPIGTWEPGAVVEIADGNPRISALVEVGPDELLPGNACANLDHEVTV
jgi:hypothetical protein